VVYCLLRPQVYEGLPPPSLSPTKKKVVAPQQKMISEKNVLSQGVIFPKMKKVVLGRGVLRRMGSNKQERIFRNYDIYRTIYIEEVFTRIASIRISEKIQGDGGY